MGHGHFLNSTGRHECFLNSTGRHWAFLKSTRKFRTPPSRAPQMVAEAEIRGRLIVGQGMGEAEDRVRLLSQSGLTNRACLL